MNIPHSKLISLLGFTPNQVAHTIEQLPALVEESVKRIKFAPFDIDHSMYVGHSGGKDSVLVRWLADLALPDLKLLTVHTPKPTGIRNEVHPITQQFLYGLNRPVLYLPDGNAEVFEAFGLKTQIDGTRAAEASRRDGRDVGVVVRGEERSRANMPLYLENGLFNRQFVYPIFDWTDLQVWAAIIHYEIPFSDEYLLAGKAVEHPHVQD